MPTPPTLFNNPFVGSPTPVLEPGAARGSTPLSSFLREFSEENMAIQLFLKMSVLSFDRYFNSVYCVGSTAINYLPLTSLSPMAIWLGNGEEGGDTAASSLEVCKDLLNISRARGESLNSDDSAGF